jgi:hypothetical protein
MLATRHEDTSAGCAIARTPNDTTGGLITPASTRALNAHPFPTLFDERIASLLGNTMEE